MIYINIKIPSEQHKHDQRMVKTKKRKLFASVLPRLTTYLLTKRTDPREGRGGGVWGVGVVQAYLEVVFSGFHLFIFFF